MAAMKCLIVEDDFISRKILKELLSTHFDCDVAVNGEEAVTAFKLAHEGKRPYDLICMDIMMPVVDGKEALHRIREWEKAQEVPHELEVKVIMTSALDDPKTVMSIFYEGGATAYMIKPVSKVKLINELRILGLIS